jgi:transposase
VEALKHLNFHCPQSALGAYRDTIEMHVREHPPQTINEAVAMLETLTGIRRSPTQVRLFLTHLGLHRRKVGLLPAKGNPDVQEEYQKKLEPRLADAQAGKRAVFFVDAAHFVFGAFLGYLWCFARCWIKAPSGRQRFNVLGALHAITHEVITATNFTSINAESVCQLLRKLGALGLQVPITLVLDNARYQRCALVQSVADTLGIELLYLPAYSPNLNLIERLWKFVKKQCLYSKYYTDFRQLPRIKIPTMRVLSYPFRAWVLARSPKSLGGDDERTEGTAYCHHQGRGPEIDRGQEKGVSSPSGFGLPQRQCSASRNRVWLVP